MKRFLLLFLLLPVLASAQSYTEMLDHESEWHVTTCFNGCLTDVYYTDGDTLFNGLTYTVLNGYHFISRTFWLREDVPEKQVYLSIKEPNKDREEFLIYDFSMAVGDSIDIKNPISPYPASPGYFVVDSIVDVVLSDGLTYRQFHLSPTASTTSTENPVWIESIGSLSLINTPGGTPDFNFAGKLSCHIHDYESIYTQLDSITACTAVYVASLEEILLPEVKVYPNPFDQNIQVQSDQIISRISIVDVTGKMMLSRKLVSSQSTELQLNGLNQGIYFLQLEFEDGRQTVKQITKKY